MGYGLWLLSCPLYFNAFEAQKCITTVKFSSVCLISDYKVLLPNLAVVADSAETVVTVILVVEMVFRFISDWRNFHRSRRNWVDLSLAVITAVIQFPPIRRLEKIYVWLTFFQIVRIYRVVLAVPLTRDLIVGSFHCDPDPRDMLTQSIDGCSWERDWVAKPNSLCVFDHFSHSNLCCANLPRGIS